MAAVWKRPSLTAIEILWRWSAGALVLLALGISLGSRGVDVRLSETPTWSQIAQPSTWAGLRDAIGPVFASSLMIVSFGVWLLAATAGRIAVLRRLRIDSHVGRLRFLYFSVLRAAVLLTCWMGWSGSLRWAAKLTGAGGADANWVSFSGLAIVLTLTWFVGWGVLSWPLQLAPLLALKDGEKPPQNLRASLRYGWRMRAGLIEVNLVLCVVKLALLVLLMVFLASPLAFTAITTQAFLTFWWTLGLLVYFAASDYFHVVRTAAYLAMMRRAETSQLI